MKNAHDSAALLGRTIRWTCTDGPVAGQTFEHSFDSTGPNDSKRTRASFVAVVPVDENVAVVSSLSESGQALMVTLNFADNRMVGFVLSHDSWTQQKAQFELLPAPA